MNYLCWGCLEYKEPEAFGTRKGRRERRCRSCETDRHLVHKHGITQAQRAEIIAAQGGCACCGELDGVTRWEVDHDRSCCPGENSCIRCRRGILCRHCNAALALARDRPDVLRRMADYLESDYRIEVTPLDDPR